MDNYGWEYMGMCVSVQKPYKYIFIKWFFYFNVHANIQFWNLPPFYSLENYAWKYLKPNILLLHFMATKNTILLTEKNRHWSIQEQSTMAQETSSAAWRELQNTELIMAWYCYST
jgi:hypothetical protein